MKATSAQEEFENLAAFRPNPHGRCEVCGQSPTVSATGLCGPCTWGEADTMHGAWWDEESERRYQKLLTTVEGDPMPNVANGPTLNGQVKWFSREKGFGFIIPENPGVDVFLHGKVVERCGNPVLPNGQEVRYRQEPASDGRVKATYVEVVR